jgi:D-glycero-alpha-D-manno-heptose-7-phosphate kinase
MLAKSRAAGAWAGKVCGAGGGGCLFVLTEPSRKAAVAAALAAAGARVLPVEIDPEGLRITRS